MPGWFSWLSVRLLISAQVLISGGVFRPCVGLHIHAGHGAYFKKIKLKFFLKIENFCKTPQIKLKDKPQTRRKYS